MNATGLIIDGKVVACSKPVYNWNDHGMKFNVPKGARPRTKKINLIALHWTAGTGDGKAVYNVLTQRKLGIDFHIHSDGTIYQFSDPTVNVTFGQGAINDFSVGIECTNFGFLSDGQKNPDTKRKIVEQIIKRRKIKVASFYPEQLSSILAVCDSLCVALQIPKTVPGDNGMFYSNQLTDKQILEHKGVCGHLNVPKTTKVDPGNEPFEFLIKNGFGLQQIK